MKEKFTLTIRTPQKDVFVGEIKSIYFDSEENSLEIFANHADLTASHSFTKTTVVIDDKNEEKYFLRNSVVYFNNEKNEAKLLALNCEKEAEVSKPNAEQYLKFVKEKLKEGKDLSQFQILYLKGEQIAIEKQLSEME